MSAEAYIDIETDGLTPTQIHLLGQLRDGEYTESFDGFTYEEGVEYYGHNSIGFDYPVLNRLWGCGWSDNRASLKDTLVLSRLANPSRDGGHSLNAWGARLGFVKGEHSDWSRLSDEMRDYCQRDVEVLAKTKQQLDKELEGFSDESKDLEHQVAWIIQSQINNGWLLDQRKCFTLLAELKEKKLELEQAVRETFVPRCKAVKEVVPEIKKNGELSLVGIKFLGERALEMVSGPFTRVAFPEFNLGSRQQIGEYLVFFGWEPQTFTPTGQPVVDEAVLSKVTGIPEAALIANYLLVQKRIAQVTSWLEAVGEDGRVHGYVNSNGAVTGRMTHSSPNMAQVPASYSPYGKDCRECWVVEDGYKLVGCDADGLELRMLAHYMDDDTYTKTVVEGKKEDGTDIHTANQQAAGLPTRDAAKTFIYAFLYGAGDAKIGSIVGGTKSDGRKLKDKFLRNTPALAALRDRVEQAARRGWLQSLDGRRIYVRSSHAALNTLLQGAGAVVMKQALVNLDKMARAHGLDYRFVGNIHDEIQTEVKAEHAVKFGKLASYAIVKAGRDFNLRCPLAAGYDIGTTWNDTH